MNKLENWEYPCEVQEFHDYANKIAKYLITNREQKKFSVEQLTNTPDKFFKALEYMQTTCFPDLIIAMDKKTFTI
jgi:hypothetical protein